MHPGAHSHTAEAALTKPMQTWTGNKRWMQPDSRIQGNSKTVLGQNITELCPESQQPHCCKLLFYCFLGTKEARIHKEFGGR